MSMMYFVMKHRTILGWFTNIQAAEIHVNEKIREGARSDEFAIIKGDFLSTRKQESIKIVDKEM